MAFLLFSWHLLPLYACISFCSSLVHTVDQLDRRSVATWIYRYKRYQESKNQSLSSLFISCLSPSHLVCRTKHNCLLHPPPRYLFSICCSWLEIKPHNPAKSMPAPLFFFLESTDVNPSFLHFLLLWHMAPPRVQDLVTDSSWPVKTREVRKRRTSKPKVKEPRWGGRREG